MPASTRPNLLSLLTCIAALPLAGADKSSGGVVATPPGERLQFEDYLEPGKTVIFGFVSDFCPPYPCPIRGKMEDPLGVLAAARDDLVVVKVDVNREGITQIDWNSPVSMQFGLRRLPHFVVYGPDGRIVAQDDQRSADTSGFDMVFAMLMELPEQNS